MDVRGGLRQVLLVYGRVPLFFYIGYILLLHAGAALWTLVWLVALVVMYYACRWYGNIERRYAYAWLSYL